MQSLIIEAVNVFFDILYFLILIRIILSWLPGIENTGIGGIIYQLTEPILGPIRRMISNSPIGGGMMLDFSPVIALFIMKVINVVINAVIMALF